jgi:protein-tyrosine phosphatase
VPAHNIVDTFLRRVEEIEPGKLMAVHCLAGLGRTGILYL